MSAVTFDVRGYAASPQGTLRAELHVSDYAQLDPELAAVLAYLRRRQSDVTAWLSVVLVTPTHKEARITAFLSTWAFERHWVADALAAMAGSAVDIPSPDPRSKPTLLLEQLAPLTEAIIANVHGQALTAVHMAERLIDSWLITVLLARVAELTADPVLSADIDRVGVVFERQERYFAETADEWLQLSPRATRLTRARLQARAWPMGAERETAASTARVFHTLFGDDTTWAERLDERVDALPGLAGLHLFSRSAANPGRPPLRTVLRPAVALGATAAGLITRRKGGSASR